MARGVVVNLGGEVSEFGLTRLNREKLYGRKTKVVVDEEGNATDTAYLTRDGTALLLKGAMAMIYVDDDFEVTERSDLQAVNADGEPLPSIPSTLGVEQELHGPVPPSRVLDHLAKSVYILEPETLGEQLREQLNAGKIFETLFSYRGGYTSNPAFLLKGEDGYFAIVGEETKFEFLYKDQAPVVEADDDDDPFDDDDLDFGMM